MSLSPIAALDRAPEARTETVANLVHLAHAGRIRVPRFQRRLNWEAKDVTTLFDSIYRGLPIGSLLMWKKPASAGLVSFGPVSFHATQTAEGWWVVDGQQRVTSLAASLLRPLPLPRAVTKQDPFVVFFDSTQGTFESPDGRLPPDDWVPLPILFDATELSEWVLDWKLGVNRERRQRVFAAGTRLREYKVPLYLVETEDEEVLKEIFARINTTGKPLKWPDVHDALYGHRGKEPSTTRELADGLSELGMGRPNEQAVLKCLIAMRGLDPTRSIDDLRAKHPNAFSGAAAEALPVITQVLSFLANHCEIPHLRLLPRGFVIELLTRFFKVHPEPGERTKTLLTRWVWRALLGPGKMDERTLQRRAIAAVVTDEASSTQALLSLVSSEAPQSLNLATTFDARTADSRLAMLALASLGPRDLQTGHAIDVAPLLEEWGSEAFGLITSDASGPENRIITASRGTARRLLLDCACTAEDRDKILASHALEPGMCDLLQRDPPAFLSKRRELMVAQLKNTSARLAAWGRDRDRPAIGEILRHVS